MNRQTLPQAISPVNGDVQTTVGSPDVTVVGIQQTPVLNQAPQEGQILIFDTNAPGGAAYVPGDPIVSGTDAPGSPSSANPVQIGGIDEGNLVREIRTDTYGSIQLSMYDRELLRQILNQLKAITRLLADSAGTLRDPDYIADQFDGVDPMQ